MTMKATTQEAVPHPYVDAFAGWDKKGPGFLREARREAMQAFRRQGFPTTKDEAWKHTSVREVARTHFVPATGAMRSLTEAEVDPYRIPGAIELVFVDGHHQSGLSRLGLPRGVRLSSLAGALLQPGERLERHLARYAGDEPFVALNTAYFQDGALLEVEKGTLVEDPIHILNLCTEPRKPTASHIRNLLLFGESSEATVVESHVGLPSGDAALSTVVTELVAGAGAQVRHVKLQRENLHAYHVGRLAVRQDRDSLVQSLLFSLGAALSRNEVDCVLSQPGAETHLNGLFLATGRQHVDCPTRIEHAVPHTTSRELYKGVLDGYAHGVFLGNVKVAAGAAKTLAEQTNRNLLLSTHAAVDTTPQLEIHNDDVKCSHGSTIGQLSADALFFLRSRGIGEEAARLMLTQAFAHEVLETAPEGLRGMMDDLLAQWFACRKVQGAMQ
jgi:Fe-S cluster assembly protein SufD